MIYDERKVIDDLHPDRKGRGAFQDKSNPVLFLFFCDE